MKQLLRALSLTSSTKTTSLSRSENSSRKSFFDSAVIVGLGIHAFLILSNDEVTQQQPSEVQVISLVPPPAPPSSKTSEQSAEWKDDPLQEILAVAIYSVPCSSSSDQKLIWCAVARGNKSLALYLVDPSDPLTSTAAPVELKPVNVYHTSKRVGCLSFCQVPDNKEDPQSIPNQPLQVLLTGDLVGDVTAYKVEVCETPPVVSASVETAAAATTSTIVETVSNEDGKEGKLKNEEGGKTKDDDEDGDDDDEETGPRRKRLLLGHTASMLTGLCLLDQHGLILTADRDEKIRVSAFPNTYLIHGFLLGHTAFVSSMAIVNLQGQPQEPLCASAGGDGMLRLWNVTSTCQELSNITAPFGQEDDDNDDTAGLVPSQIAVHNATVIVLYDQSSRVDLYDITQNDAAESSNGDKKYELQWIQTLQCPASPLSAVSASDKSSGSSFWVLCREPAYLLRLDVLQTSGSPTTVNWNEGDAVTTGLQQAITSTVSNTPTVASDEGTGGEGADKNVPIVMPASIWERDVNGLLKVAKVHDKRYGGSTDTQLPTPWNRADRIEIARQRNMRHKKRRQEKSEARYFQRKEAKKQQQEQKQEETEEKVHE